MKKCSFASAVVMVVFIVGLVSLPFSKTWAGMGNPKNPKVMPPHSHPFGKSYSEWSAEWWKWQLRLPVTNHPAFDETGEFCAAGQDGKVWFLTGAFTTEVPEDEYNVIVRENCPVPTGKAIFFPIVNIECSNVEEEPYLLIEEGLDANVDTCAAKFVEGPFAEIKYISVIIDGKELENPEQYRVQSPVFDLSFDNPDDNMLGVDCGVVDCDNMRSVSDGYWIMLPPMSKGEHTIQFIGSFRDPITDDLYFGLDVTYEITVVGGMK